MRPDLCDIEWVEAVLLGILGFHDLDIDGPGWIVASLDGIEEIAGGIVGIRAGEPLSLIGLEVLDTLVTLEVPLDVLEVALVVNELESVRRVTVHETVAIGGTTVGEEDGDLVDRFGDKRQEIPECIYLAGDKLC